MKLYNTVEELKEEQKDKTIFVAKQNGFTVKEPEDEEDYDLYGFPGSNKIFRIYNDGSWERLDLDEISGEDSVSLKVFFVVGEKDYRGQAIQQTKK
jgi:hypothetical protein